MTTRARLEGGPCDGDNGPLILDNGQPPGAIWAVQCANPAQCDLNGVHWWQSSKAAEADAKRQAERHGWGNGLTHHYLHARVTDNVHVYVYGELTGTGRSKLGAEPRPLEQVES